MNKLKNIFLPGTDKQVITLTGNVNIENNSILILGPGTEEIAKLFSEHCKDVIIIVEDYDNLIQLRYIMQGFKNVGVRMMEFVNTDFKDEKFDIVYAQASVSTSNRNKIVKEVKRILKPNGVFCVGEIVNLVSDIPKFVSDIWTTSGLSPLSVDEISPYYKSKGFDVLLETDLSLTLTDFYSSSHDMLKASTLSEDEQVYHKKLLKKMSHEANAYLRLGGQAYMGFRLLILRKA